jgi:hypothetical protein
MINVISKPVILPICVTQEMHIKFWLRNRPRRRKFEKQAYTLGCVSQLSEWLFDDTTSRLFLHSDTCSWLFSSSTHFLFSVCSSFVAVASPPSSTAPHALFQQIVFSALLSHISSCIFQYRMLLCLKVKDGMLLRDVVRFLSCCNASLPRRLFFTLNIFLVDFTTNERLSLQRVAHMLHCEHQL